MRSNVRAGIPKHGLLVFSQELKYENDINWKAKSSLNVGRGQTIIN